MKKILIYICQFISALLLFLFSYRLGYCNGCDKYIGATECKPSRRLRFFNLKF